MMERILIVGTITLATTCALQMMKLLILPYKAIYQLFSRLGDLLGCNTFGGGAIRVPTFYAPPIVASGVIRMGITTMIVATLFGGIHCTGWNFPFPSHAELIIWRVSSLIIVIVPCIFLPLLVAAFMKDNPAITDIINMVYVGLFLFGIVIYVPARLALFVEAFIALRHLPPGAYAVVKWTALLLHM